MSDICIKINWALRQVLKQLKKYTHLKKPHEIIRRISNLVISWLRPERLDVRSSIVIWFVIDRWIYIDKICDICHKDWQHQYKHQKDYSRFGYSHFQMIVNDFIVSPDVFGGVVTLISTAERDFIAYCCYCCHFLAVPADPWDKYARERVLHAHRDTDWEQGDKSRLIRVLYKNSTADRIKSNSRPYDANLCYQQA